jgi:DNA repair and recombination protein RAD54 and RAD54-like protein
LEKRQGRSRDSTRSYSSRRASPHCPFPALHDRVRCTRFLAVAAIAACMLRRIPSTSDGKPVDRLVESTRINKPFRPPSLAKPADARVQPQRKRKRVSYKNAGGDDDDDDDSRSKKKKNDRFGDQGPPPDNTHHYPVFSPKPFEEHATRRFSIPVITKDGQVVPTVQTNISLGIRPAVNIIPRPLHDPMEDHAIVLYDPTIDDRETDEEKKEREKEEAKKKAEEEAREKSAGLWNPHKSLKDLLGGGKDKKKINDKVPVVIDPRLCKILRPHQVEGVKVSQRNVCRMNQVHSRLHSSCSAARQA